MPNPAWLLLIVSLPTARTGARMRLWRATKAAGAIALRDGAYLLPDTPPCRALFEAQAGDMRQCGGDVWLLGVQPLVSADADGWLRSFDRSADYAALVADARAAGIDEGPPLQAGRRLQALWRRHAQIAQSDHFAGQSQRQSAELLTKLQDALTRRIGPPDDARGAPAAAVERLDPRPFRGRIWATRVRPSIDGLASAWLVRRFVDPDARLRWLAEPSECRSGWIGFDFDGARFSQRGGRVTFETLLGSFGLDADPALRRVGDLVHFLEMGGTPVAQASGIEAALGGLREHLQDDDALLDAACAVFDGLQRALEGDKAAA